MSIDFLLSREYDRQAYNCLHFSAEAWEYLTGDRRLHLVEERAFRAGRVVEIFRGLRRQADPTVAPSIALMDAPDGQLHMGVCLRRRLLHINESGPQFFLVEAISATYRNMRFYL
ncbi:hypothetical protein AXYL_04013 [Achromobacter xylosoxidans A8]|uniref:Uncharacterized protein n=1 Tax=Achromobacter xylosoxidans (strain A8) TaxID=762376 RepID=E3HSL6_ACHXA|nr:hypothetical protein AXYL_04013 [Achromobacter xylosoxidans A8]